MADVHVLTPIEQSEMGDAEINVVNDKAREMYLDDIERRAAFEAGHEAAPGLPWVSRRVPTTEETRRIANAIRAKQGLPPLP